MELLLGLRLIAGTAVELTEAEVAVGDQGAHAELLGPEKGLAVVRFGGVQVGRVGLRGDLTEEAQNPGLVAAFLLPMCEVETTAGGRERIIRAASQEVRLTEVGHEKRMVGAARRPRVGERLLQEGHALGEAPRQRVRIPEMPSRDVEEARRRDPPAP